MEVDSVTEINSFSKHFEIFVQKDEFFLNACIQCFWMLTVYISNTFKTCLSPTTAKFLLITVQPTNYGRSRMSRQRWEKTTLPVPNDGQNMCIYVLEETL